VKEEMTMRQQVWGSGTVYTICANVTT
jgi:hypothetical protein